MGLTVYCSVPLEQQSWDCQLILEVFPCTQARTEVWLSMTTTKKYHKWWSTKSQLFFRLVVIFNNIKIRPLKSGSFSVLNESWKQVIYRGQSLDQIKSGPDQTKSKPNINIDHWFRFGLDQCPWKWQPKGIGPCLLCLHNGILWMPIHVVTRLFVKQAIALA